MRYLILVSLLFSSTITFAGEDCSMCVGDLNLNLVRIDKSGIDDIVVWLGTEHQDWTVDDSYQGKKIVLELRTQVGATYETSSPDSRGFLTRYLIGDFEAKSSFSEKTNEYFHIKFNAITKEEVQELKKGDGVKIIRKVVNYGQFNLKKDLPIAENLYASFEPVRKEMALGYKVSDKVLLELNGESAIGYSFASTTTRDYEDSSNVYLSLQGGARINHDNYGAVKFSYRIDSGVAMGNIRGNQSDTSREGRVRLAYEFDLNKETTCGVYGEKRSFQLNPGYDEINKTKQDRLYEKAKTFGIGCSVRWK